MAIRQYIGARYVPRFMGTYDASQVYEGLVVVDNGMGTSYISKKPTPAGTPLTDTSYWAIYGATSGAIINLQNQIDGIVNNDLPPITDAIAEIKDLTYFSNKKILFIGDSYCDPGRGGQAYGVYTKFCSNTGFTDNVNIKLYAKGGAGFEGAGQGKTFGNLLSDAITEGFFNPDEVTDIIVAGGDNDQNYSISDINNAKDTFTATAHSTYPNAKIWIACIGGFVSAVSRYNLISKVNYVYTFEPRPFVYPVFNAMAAMSFMDSFDSDGVHPNSNGVVRMGRLLASAFMSNSNYGTFSITINQNVTLNAVAGEVTTPPTFEVNIQERYTSIQFKRTSNLGVANAQSLAYNTGALIKIGSVDTTKTFLCPNAASTSADNFKAIPAELFALRSSTTWVTLSGEIIIVETGATTADVYFRAHTAPETFNCSSFRCGYVKAIIPNS